MDKDIILQMKNITKIYPGVKALDNIDFDLRKGEIHALVGENGAGKSTLIKVLSGAILPEEGEIIFENKEVKNLNPKKSQKLGIGVIYQELNLIPYLTVAQNIFLGNEIKSRSFTDNKKMNKKAEEILRNLGVNINPKERVRNLSIAYQQMIEIAKAELHDVKILILDEPTAPLPNHEVENLFKLINELKNKGISIIYVSHRMEEIFRITDRVTVFRDGQKVKTLNTKNTNRKELISLMVGRELNEYYPEGEFESHEKALAVKKICNSKLKNVTFDVYKGEILGIGGLVGSGRTELARAIFGADNIESGEIYWNDKLININSPSSAIKKGIGLIPEDRKEQGLILGLSIKKNTTLASLRNISKYNLINMKEENNIVNKICSDLRVKTDTYGKKVKFLSGGNQQKVVLSKWLAQEMKLLIFDEPTRGIDVGAKQEIYTLMRELTKKGMAIIMISSDMPELIGMADRIIVMAHGEVTGELAKKDISQNNIMELASN